MHGHAGATPGQMVSQPTNLFYSRSKEPEGVKLEMPMPVAPVPLPRTAGDQGKISPLVEPAAPVAAQEKPALEAYEDEAFEALARKATKAGQGIAKGSDQGQV